MELASQLIARLEAGDGMAGEQLFPLLYEQLRGIAKRKLAEESAAQSLQATALVHEAYMKMCNSAPQGNLWASEPHFLGIAANAMRQVLVEHARHKSRTKRGGGQWKQSDIPIEEWAGLKTTAREVLELNDALEQFKQVDPTAVQLVELRFFYCLTQAEAALALGISKRSADRIWAYARAWLFDAIQAARK